MPVISNGNPSNPVQGPHANWDVTRLTLRSLSAARRLPQEPPESVVRLECGQDHPCQTHGVSFERVLLTTYGDGGAPGVWQAYPLALDMWLCPEGEHFEHALLSPQEVDAFLARGTRAAQAGDLDEAEFYFRRVVASWPGYAFGHLNLGSVYLDRLKRCTEQDLAPIREVAIDQLEQAIAGRPRPPHRVWLMLAQLHVRGGWSERAVEVLEELSQMPDLDRATKDELASLYHQAAPRRSTTVYAPYLLTDAMVARRDAALRAEGLPEEGHENLLELVPGLYQTVAEELGDQVVPLFPTDLEGEEASFAVVSMQALSRIDDLVGSDALPVSVFPVSDFAIPPIWRPGVHPVIKELPTVPLMVVGPSWMAAAATCSKVLIQGAQRTLGTQRLRALVPHRDLAFIFAARSEQLDQLLAEGILSAEAGNSRPLSKQLFWLGGSGLTTMGLPARLDEILFAAKKNETRESIKSRWPRPEDWHYMVERELLCWRSPSTLEPLIVRYELPNGRLRAVHVQVTCTGSYQRFVELDAQLRAWMPELPLTTAGNPWSVHAARASLEGGGTAEVMLGTPIECNLGERARLFGKALAFNRDGLQHYGFEFRFFPEITGR